MDVLELYHLANWYRSDFKELRRLYNELRQAVNHNATQPSKVPVEPVLSPLLEYLRERTLGELSIQELDLLEQLGVRNLLGPEGADNLTATVKTATYDPATTDLTINKNLQNLNQVYDWLGQYELAVQQLGIPTDATIQEDAEHITIRVGFKNDASIRNIKDWKSSADDWYQIVRGLGMVCGEAPEDTRVVGASTGSVILILSATVGFTGVLATISKHISGIAKNVIDVRIALEDLRGKRLLNDKVEAEFRDMERQRREEGLAAIQKDLEAMLPKPPNGEQSNALAKAVSKLVTFGEEGGDIDFVAPEPPAAEEGEENRAAEGQAEEVRRIQAVRNLILEYQEQREAVRLLSDQSEAR